jgi:CubicO group peptidase (beta-lactamase class C family)
MLAGWGGEQLHPLIPHHDHRSCFTPCERQQLISRRVLVTMVILLSLLSQSALGAQAAPSSPVPSVPHQQGPTDPQEMEAFLDPFFAEQMKQRHIPGAVFLVVKDGESFFTMGYGFAEVEKKTPVVPDTTLFRVASISKLFTATAVMQLAEQGLLNLDEDVNQYLTLFQLEATYPQPVTMAHLLTDTGGFDERVIGMAAQSEAEVVPLGPYLAAKMPPCVRPPGEVFSYSNHGMALAGYLVEVSSGVPFAQYIDEHILQPLGMQRSSFLLPSHLVPDLAVGYEYGNGTYQPLPFDYLNVAPAGALVTTATDLARFLIAHLQGGRYGETRILQEATVQEMHRQHFTHHSRLPGVAYGFFEAFRNNQRALWHNGGWRGFGSRVFLLPAQQLGFFVACNTWEYPCLPMIDDLTTQFLDHYYPMQETPAPSEPSATIHSRADRFVGSYRYVQFVRRAIRKLAALDQELRVTASDDGTLTLYYPGNFLAPTHWVAVEPLLFRRVDNNDSLAFREDDYGHITHMFMTRCSWDSTPLTNCPGMTLRHFTSASLGFARWSFSPRVLFGQLAL